MQPWHETNDSVSSVLHRIVFFFFLFHHRDGFLFGGGVKQHAAAPNAFFYLAATRWPQSNRISPSSRVRKVLEALPKKKKPRSSSVCGAVMWVESQKVWGEKVSCKHHLTPTKMQLWFKPTRPPPSKTTRFSGHKHCYDICFHISQPLQFLCVALLYECCKHICFYSSLDFRKPFCVFVHAWAPRSG